MIENCWPKGPQRHISLSCAVMDSSVSTVLYCTVLYVTWATNYITSSAPWIIQSNILYLLFYVLSCSFLFCLVLRCSFLLCFHVYLQPDCDPHPGNLACDSELGGRLIFYDFGTSPQNTAWYVNLPYFTVLYRIRLNDAALLSTHILNQESISNFSLNRQFLRVFNRMDAHTLYTHLLITLVLTSTTTH